MPTRFFAAAILLFAATSPVLRADILDQSHMGGILGNLNGGIHWQQEVTAGMDGILSRVAILSLRRQTITFGVTPGSAFQTGPFAYSARITVDGPVTGNVLTTTYVDVSAAAILLSQGDKFVISISESDAGCCFMVGKAGSYPNGRLFRKIGNDAPSQSSAISLPFETYMQPVSVPEPAALATLALLIPATMMLKRRRRIRANELSRSATA